MPSERDDFWDISKLIPKKKNTASPFSTKEKTVDYTVPGEVDNNGDNTDNSTKLTALSAREEDGSVVHTYSGGFIRSVTITRFVDKYDFYGNFRKAALIYYDYKTDKCEFAPFYSYMPQYSQLNSQQKNYYFYWRDSVRRGKYIKTDYSYLYLYVYEILNLPDKISAEKGIEILTSLWREYRRELPNIDTYMSLWVQDYCLVYNLPCPMDKIGDFIFDVIGAAEFKEFYLSDAESMGEDGVGAIIAYLSDYDWRRGKYAGGDNREIYAKHLIGAMGMLIGRLRENGELTASASETAHINKIAFRNSLCTHSVKCKLDIEYIPLAKADNIRRSVTAALRYTENKLRSLLSVKSRLAIKDLPDEYKAVIDHYFDRIYDRVNRERRKAEEPEYERLYDAEHQELSFAGADEIERASWTTTARLVVDEEDKVEMAEPDVNFKKSEEPVGCSVTVTEKESEAMLYGLTPDEVEFVRCVKNLDVGGIKAISQKIGAMPDAIAEKINEAFADGFGDVIIEGENTELNIIEDYEDDIEEWLLKLTK